ncbi:MAG: hypothetical protein ACK5X3_23840, partial [Pseudomonadota bacterium]
WNAPPAGTYPSDRGWSRFPFQRGDQLLVRETLDMGHHGGCPICKCTYAADGAPVDLRPAPFWAPLQQRNLVPSIHMPRWASRITLIVEAVKVERLQDISEADAIAEGVRRDSSAFMHAGWWVYDGEKLPSGEPANVTTKPIDSFASLWRSINGPDSCDANPWDAAITFRVVAEHPAKGEW